MAATLQHTPADIVRRLLIALECGSDPSAPRSAQAKNTWPIYARKLGDEVDGSIVVTNQVGVMHGREMVTGKQGEHHGIQIAIRGPAVESTYRRANLVKVAIDDQLNDVVTIAGTRYLVWCITRRTDIVDAGDEPGTKRKLYTINAIVALKQL